MTGETSEWTLCILSLEFSQISSTNLKLLALFKLYMHGVYVCDWDGGGG